MLKEIYYLNKPELPTIPVPHDVVIKEIRFDKENLYFVSEDDISYHDSIKEIRPDARSLMIRYHLPDGIDGIDLYIEKKRGKLFHKSTVLKRTDRKKLYKTLSGLPKEKLVYLYHNVGYGSVIIKLWYFGNIVLDLESDYAELEWIN